MREQTTIALVALLVAVTSQTHAADCVCTQEISRRLYYCTDRSMFATNLYSDLYDNPCMLAAPEVLTPSDWVAGILEDEVEPFLVKLYNDHKFQLKHI